MTSYILGERKRKFVNVRIIIAAVFLLILVVGALVLHQVYDNNLKPVSASQKSVLITIPSGASVHDIAVELQSKGIIKAAWAFEWYVRNKDLRDRLQAGTYNLRPNQNIPEIITILTQGKVATDLVTFLPGQRLDQIRTALINNAGFPTDKVDAALKSDLYHDHPALADKPTGANLEGYLYPDSYQKTAETTPQELIKASLDEMQKRLTPEVRAAIVKQGLTVHEGVILASMIEQEVSNSSDKAIVAQVFLKRLREGMPLASDPTAIYGAIKAGVSPSLSYDSPYNTYLHPGLPPGPISNVTAASLQAVAHPAETDFLYFVAGDDGKTYFSHTLEEHEALTAEHCKKLCQH